MLNGYGMQYLVAHAQQAEIPVGFRMEFGKAAWPGLHNLCSTAKTPAIAHNQNGILFENTSMRFSEGD